MESNLKKLAMLLCSNRKTLLKVIIGSVLFFSTMISGFSQDMQFSQYYKAPLYLNPAFAGSTKDHRFILNYRNQWPSIPKAFTFYSFSYDVNVDKYNSGFGVMITSDKAGSAGLRATSIGYVYSYKMRMGDWIVSPGLNFSYGIRDLDFNRLVFGDQLEFNGPTVDEAAHKYTSIQYFDFGSGFLAYNKSIWFGYSVHHLNEPNFSLLEQESLLPMKHSFHGGVKIPLNNGPFKRNKISSLAPSIIYKKQGNFSQLDLGTYLLYDPITIGLWYRGVPFKKNVSDQRSHDAVAAIFGLRLDGFEFGYSYDVTVSRLGTASGGAHEISLSYLLNSRNKNNPKPKKFIPCPAFYDRGLF
jgi:type IX secretion system PorP/SprF family membrane protein